MKKLIVSMFVSAVLICGLNVMAQSTTSKTKAPEKAKTEVKSEVAKKPVNKTKTTKKVNTKKAVSATEKTTPVKK